MPTPRRLSPLRIALTVLAVLVLAGVAAALLAGGSKHHGPTGPRSYLLRSGEQPGYSVTSTPNHVELAAPGFETGFQETLGAPQGRAGFTLIVVFRTRTGALAAASSYLRAAESGARPRKIRPFTVAGVRSARGFTGQGAPVSLANAYWTVGRCMLGSGLDLPNATASSADALAKPVIAGVESQSSRIAAHCP